jgi:hypothetical protein
MFKLEFQLNPEILRLQSNLPVATFGAIVNLGDFGREFPLGKIRGDQIASVNIFGWFKALVTK